MISKMCISAVLERTLASYRRKMFTKIILFLGLLSICQAGFFSNLFHKSHHETTGHGVSSQSVVLDHGHENHILQHDDHGHEYHDEHAHPRYEYKYTVADGKTDDQKSHWETRDGDRVEGRYSLVQPDGSTRTVTYSADGHNGFKANVQTTGGHQHLDNIYHHPEIYQQDVQTHNYHH